MVHSRSRPLSFVGVWLVTLLGYLILVSSGCQVDRALKQPIPGSNPIGIHDDRTERIGRVVRDTMRNEGIPGISIAVIDHGELVWAQGFGWRDIGRKLPVDTDTQFQAGSISKPVTALGVLVLNTYGALDLDGDVNDYLTGVKLKNPFPDNPVTIRELLCHRAGMVPHGFAGFGESEKLPALDAILSGNYFLNGPIKMAEPPGSKFQYSGGGYCVVQKVVEDITGQPFEEAMSRTLLEPLGMVRSHFCQPPPDDQIENTARGYGWMKDLWCGGRWCVFPQKAAAGLWTTPQDLARLILAVQHARAGDPAGPISPEIAEQFLKPQFDENMGIGIFLDGEGKNRGFFHAGENFGYFARFGAGVLRCRAWIIMTNAQKDRFTPIVEAIIKEFGWVDDDSEDGGKQ